jgi:hypothetical protein
MLDMDKFTLEHQVSLYGYYVKYKPAKKCQRKFRRKFPGIRVPHRNIIHNGVNKSGTDMLVNSKPKHC